MTDTDTAAPPVVKSFARERHVILEKEKDGGLVIDGMSLNKEQVTAIYDFMQVERAKKPDICY